MNSIPIFVKPKGIILADKFCSITIELLDIEGDISMREIQTLSYKIQILFKKIEIKVVSLNDARYKLT